VRRTSGCRLHSLVRIAMWDIALYALFGVMMVVCLWYIMGSLSDDL
jgi:hypothetical protein